MTEQTCLNCGTSLAGKYCAACGQGDQDLRRPFWALAADYIEGNFSIDSKMWRTLGLMAVAPGAVARRHLDGKRVRYINPVKFYAIVTIIFFVILGLSDVTLLRLDLRLDERPTPSGVEPTYKDRSIVFYLSLLAPNELAKPFDPKLYEKVRETIRAIDASEPERTKQGLGLVRLMADFAEHPERTNDVLATWLPRLIVLLFPLFAAWLWLIYATRRVRLYDHLVFSLYFHTFLFLVLTILIPIAHFAGPQLPGNALGAAFGLCAVAHLSIAMWRVYGGGVLAVAWRFVAAVAGYAVAFVIALRLLFLGFDIPAASLHFEALD
ncbi:MAG: DUF3667 domain-containing protein [Rhodospirillaceae bacterium]|nr:DUF3667 domain-containing protein [Rhodospirillaceae bacterium]